MEVNSTFRVLFPLPNFKVSLPAYDGSHKLFPAYILMCNNDKIAAVNCCCVFGRNSSLLELFFSDNWLLYILFLSLRMVPSLCV